MFDKRLFSLAPGVGRLVAAKVLCQWVGLLANVVFVVTVVVMLSPALAVVESAFDPMFSMGDSGLISRLFIGFGYGGFSAETYVGCVLAIVVCAVLRFLMMRAAAYFGAEAAERVKLALREQLFNKIAIITESKPSQGMSATIKGTYRLPSRLFGSMRRSIANTMTADANHSNAVSSEARVSRRVSLRWTSPSRVMRTPLPFHLPVSLPIPRNPQSYAITCCNR